MLKELFERSLIGVEMVQEIHQQLSPRVNQRV